MFDIKNNGQINSKNNIKEPIFIPGNNFNSQFKKMKGAGVPPCTFLFCVIQNGGFYKIGGFEECSGLNISIETDTFRDLRKNKEVELPKNIKYDNIVLKQGYQDEGFIKTWFDRSVFSYSYYTDAAVILLDITKRYITRLAIIKNAWIKAYNPETLSTQDDAGIWLHSITIAHEGWRYCDFDNSLAIDNINGANNNIVYYKSDDFLSDKNIVDKGQTSNSDTLKYHSYLNNE